MLNPAQLTREQLSALAGGNPRIMKAIELLLASVGTDIPAQIAALQVLTQVFTSTTPGIVPASGGGTAFLRANGAWSHGTDYLNLTDGYIPVAPVVGDMWSDGNAALNYQATANVAARLGQDAFIRVKASGAITKGNLCVFTGAVGASGVITAAPAGAGITFPEAIIGIAAENIALNGFGLIQILGGMRGIDTTGTPYGEAWADGDILYYSPSAGGLTKVYPTSGIIVTVAAVTNAGGGGGGSLLIRPTHEERITAGFGISVTQAASGVTVALTNTAYTVATLPAGAAGQRAYVTDATAPTFLGALTGGGAVVCPVFHNGVAWVAG